MADDEPNTSGAHNKEGLEEIGEIINKDTLQMMYLKAEEKYLKEEIKELREQVDAHEKLLKAAEERSTPPEEKEQLEYIFSQIMASSSNDALLEYLLEEKIKAKEEEIKKDTVEFDAKYTQMCEQLAYDRECEIKRNPWYQELLDKEKVVEKKKIVLKSKKEEIKQRLRNTLEKRKAEEAYARETIINFAQSMSDRYKSDQLHAEHKRAQEEIQSLQKQIEKMRLKKGSTKITEIKKLKPSPSSLVNINQASTSQEAQAINKTGSTRITETKKFKLSTSSLVNISQASTSQEAQAINKTAEHSEAYLRAMEMGNNMSPRTRLNTYLNKTIDTKKRYSLNTTLIKLNESHLGKKATTSALNDQNVTMNKSQSSTSKYFKETFLQPSPITKLNTSLPLPVQKAKNPPVLNESLRIQSKPNARTVTAAKIGMPNKTGKKVRFEDDTSDVASKIDNKPGQTAQMKTIIEVLHDEIVNQSETSTSATRDNLKKADTLPLSSNVAVIETGQNIKKSIDESPSNSCTQDQMIVDENESHVSQSDNCTNELISGTANKTAHYSDDWTNYPLLDHKNYEAHDSISYEIIEEEDNGEGTENEDENNATVSWKFD